MLLSAGFILSKHGHRVVLGSDGRSKGRVASLAPKIRELEQPCLINLGNRGAESEWRQDQKHRQNGKQAVHGAQVRMVVDDEVPAHKVEPRDSKTWRSHVRLEAQSSLSRQEIEDHVVSLQ
eukprot:4904825-Pleurochrysis_carterae.AAC.1